jgi:molecular chaperone GrpE
MADKKPKKNEEPTSNTDGFTEEPVLEEKSEFETALEEAKNEAESYKSQYLRALADYSNFERRVLEEQENQKLRIKSDVINKLLPFLDNVEKAEVFIKDTGLKMVKDQFLQTIKQLGVEEIELEGTEFDPHTAEVVEVVEGDTDNIILKVSRKAYKLGDRIIQHGLVTVSKIEKVT